MVQVRGRDAAHEQTHIALGGIDDPAAHPARPPARPSRPPNISFSDQIWAKVQFLEIEHVPQI